MQRQWGPPSVCWSVMSVELCRIYESQMPFRHIRRNDVNKCESIHIEWDIIHCNHGQTSQPISKCSFSFGNILSIHKFMKAKPHYNHWPLSGSLHKAVVIEWLRLTNPQRICRPFLLPVAVHAIVNIGHNRISNNRHFHFIKLKQNSQSNALMFLYQIVDFVNIFNLISSEQFVILTNNHRLAECSQWIYQNATSFV